jgi:RNA recognition motif-containing protein
MKLWIGNIAPGTNDEELRAFLGRYGIEPELVASISQAAPEGSRPGAIVEIAATADRMNKLTERLNGMYWKGRSLTVQTMTR